MAIAASVGRRLVVLDPTAELETTPATRVAREASLAGKTVGLLDNSKLNAGRFLELLAEELKTQYGVTGAVVRRKPSASLVVEGPVAAELAAQTDFVIAAIGD